MEESVVEEITSEEEREIKNGNHLALSLLKEWWNLERH